MEKEIWYELNDKEKKNPIVLYNVTNEVLRKQGRDRSGLEVYYKIESGRLHWTPFGKRRISGSFQAQKKRNGRSRTTN